MEEERMNLVALGYDPARGTIGASRLGDVVGPDRGVQDRPPRKCAYVIRDDQGKVVGTCGTILREGNKGCFCAMHTRMEPKGAKYIAREEEKKRQREARKRLHLIR